MYGVGGQGPDWALNLVQVFCPPEWEKFVLDNGTNQFQHKFYVCSSKTDKVSVTQGPTGFSSTHEFHLDG